MAGAEMGPVAFESEATRRAAAPFGLERPRGYVKHRESLPW